MTFRTTNSLTQTQLAKALDVSRQTIINIERQQNEPSLALAVKMARYFDTTVEDLFEFPK